VARSLRAKGGSPGGAEARRAGNQVRNLGLWRGERVGVLGLGWGGVGTGIGDTSAMRRKWAAKCSRGKDGERKRKFGVNEKGAMRGLRRCD